MCVGLQKASEDLPGKVSSRDRRRKNVSKTSSGYGSYSSESEPDTSDQLRTVAEHELYAGFDAHALIRRVSRADQLARRTAAQRDLEKSRRRSVPAYLRDAFSGKTR